MFTSLQDDTAGGDTNGDGALSTPAAGDWGGIQIDNGGTATLDRARVAFAGVSSNSAAGVALRQSRVEQGDVSISGFSSASDSTPVTVTDDVIDGGRLFVGMTRTANGSTPLTVSRNQVLDAPGLALAVVASGSGAAIPVPVVQDNVVRGAADAAIWIDGDALDPSKLTGNSGSDNKIPTFALEGTLTGDLTLPNSNLAPEIGSSIGGGTLTIAKGATLTVQPGTVVKAAGNNLTPKLVVQGSLVASGTAAEPVVFTSLQDDTAGGDTNGDGALSTPAAGDWGGIQIDNTGSASLLNVRLRYASTALAVADEAQASVTGAILDSTVGVSANTWVDARGVNWGDPSGPAPIGHGTQIAGGGVFVTPWAGYVAPARPPYTPWTPPVFNDCRRFLVVGARGSGEAPQGDPPSYTDTADGMGSRAYDAYFGFQNFLSSTTISISSCSVCATAHLALCSTRSISERTLTSTVSTRAWIG